MSSFFDRPFWQMVLGQLAATIVLAVLAYLFAPVVPILAGLTFWQRFALVGVGALLVVTALLALGPVRRWLARLGKWLVSRARAALCVPLRWLNRVARAVEAWSGSRLATSRPSPPGTTGGPAQPLGAPHVPSPPHFPGVIEGPKKELRVTRLHYELWTKKLKLDWEQGDLLVSAQVYVTDPLTGWIRTKPEFWHIEAFMGAMSLFQIPSPVAARLVVYRKDSRGAVVAKITADFHLHESPAKVILVGGPAEQASKARSTIDRAATELSTIEGVSVTV